MYWKHYISTEGGFVEPTRTVMNELQFKFYLKLPQRYLGQEFVHSLPRLIPITLLEMTRI